MCKYPAGIPRPRLARRTESAWRHGMTAVVFAAILLLQLGAWAAIDQAKPGETPAPRPTPAADPHAGMTGAGAGMAGHGAGSHGTPGGMSQQQILAERFAKQDRTAFERGIRLDAFRLIAINHLDQMKIIDSWARQSLSKIRNRQSIDGKDPLYTALDMAFRPDAWADQRIIYVQAIPVREQLTLFAQGATEQERRVEAERIMQQGLVSPNFLLQQQVLARLDDMGRDSTRAAAVGKVYTSIDTFMRLAESLNFLPPPAAPGWTPHDPWINPLPIAMPALQTAGGMPPATLPAAAASPYDADTTRRIKLAFQQMALGWAENDVTLSNTGIASFVALAPTIDPPHYPSQAKRTVELWYNRTFNGTLLAFVYFLAMTLFLLTAVGVVRNRGRVETTALAALAVAVGLHIVVMGIRWWLAGRIPIQNQFESVLGAAMFGCLIGLLLEWKKRNGIYGVAFSFVGFLATTTLLAAPYVFGTDLGGAVGKVAGILNSAWLYIHVNVVIASYALIFAAAVIGLIYLGLRLWHWVNPVEPGSDELASPPSGGGSIGGGQALSMAGGVATAAAPSTLSVADIESTRAASLDTLDQANMVVLQMAMWLLGIGIICGAVWADRSWGRPWGWDPKETFALVTWIVYLIIVHLRFVTRAKADWTAALAVVGCVVMLFNWIGVNFFLKGLHSYA